VKHAATGGGGGVVRPVEGGCGPDAARPHPARAAPATPGAIGHPRLGSRRPRRSGGAPTRWRSAPGSWASRAGRLWCVGPRVAWEAGGRQLVELGAERETAHRMGRCGPLLARRLGGIAAVGQGIEGASGPLRREHIEEVPGPLTAGTIRHVALWGWRGCARECASHGDTAAVAGPTRAGTVHAAQHAVHAPQRTVCLTGGARTMAVVGKPLDRGTGFFLGGSGAAAPHDLALGHPLRRQADDSAPELPAFGGAGTPAEDRAARTVLDGSRPGQPPRGCHGVAGTGQGPAAGQSGQGVPRRGGKETLKQRPHHSAKG
jgi:hypothetical protein